MRCHCESGLAGVVVVLMMLLTVAGTAEDPWKGQFDPTVADLVRPRWKAQNQKITHKEREAFLVYREPAYDRDVPDDKMYAEEVEVIDSTDGFITVKFVTKGSLGMQFDKDLRIMTFVDVPGSRQGIAQKCGLLEIGDQLVQVNGDNIEGLDTADAFQVLEEAASANTRDGQPRIFRFRLKRSEQGSGEELKVEHAGAFPLPSIRMLSDDASVSQQGALEYLEVCKTRQMESVKFSVLFSTDIGPLPINCMTNLPLVFVEPADACTDEISTGPSTLSGAIAIVRRGTCSYLSKASHMKQYNVSGLIIINTQDERIRARIGEFEESDIPFPVAMISREDGDRLGELDKKFGSGLGRSLSGKLVGTPQCAGTDTDAIKLAKLKKEAAQSTSAAQESLVGASSLAGLPEEKLSGSLAPSGTLRLKAPSSEYQRLEASFDFIAASFSGSLPFEHSFLLTDKITRGTEPMAFIVTEWDGDALQKVLQSAWRANSAAYNAYPQPVVVLLASRNSSIYQLGAVLPAPESVAVVMITNYAARYLTERLRWKVELRPDHQVKHEWDILRRLESEKSLWPQEERARRRLLARVARQSDSRARGASTCLRSHLSVVANQERLEL